MPRIFRPGALALFGEVGDAAVLGGSKQYVGGCGVTKA